jgi:hypothetical protein
MAHGLGRCPSVDARQAAIATPNIAFRFIKETPWT